MLGIVHRNPFGQVLRIGFILALLATAAVASAASVEDLYSVIVKADEEAEDPRLAATQAAMAGLLVRLTGERGVASDPLVLPLIESAERFVEQWGYATAEDVVVTFDGEAVEAQMRRLNLPLWGTERPLTLAWVVFDSGRGQRSIVGVAAEEEDAEGPDPVAFLRDMIEETAAERGVPLLLPLLDAEDLAALSVADVWGGFNDQIERASQRYGADAILVGRLRASGNAIAARWSLITGDSFAERRGTVRDGIDWLADTYAAQYAVTGGAQLRRILVSDIRSFDDYGRVMAFMEQLSLVESLAVEELAEDTLLLSMRVRGREEVWQRPMTLGNVLRPVPPPLALEAAVADAYFRVAH